MPIIFPPGTPGLINRLVFSVFPPTLVRPTLYFLHQKKSKQELTRANKAICNLSVHLSWVSTLQIRSTGAEKQICYPGEASGMICCWVLCCRANGQCSWLRLLADCTETGRGNATNWLLPIGIDGERQPNGSVWSNCTERYPKSCTKQRTELDLSSRHFCH